MSRLLSKTKIGHLMLDFTYSVNFWDFFNEVLNCRAMTEQPHIVLLKFSPEPKFEPELLRTGPKFKVQPLCRTEPEVQFRVQQD